MANRVKKIRLIFGIVILLAVIAVCVFYHRISTDSMESFQIGPRDDPGRWTYYLTDGTEIFPEDGILPVVDSDGTVICETQITEKIYERPFITVVSNSSDCVFLLDGTLVYSPSGRYEDGVFSSSEYIKGSASGKFELHMTEDSGHLTMIVQMQGEENRLIKMPQVTLYPEILNYLSSYVGYAAKSAVPAGMYFMIALFAAGIFLMGLWKGKTDPGLVLLAFGSLSMAFSYTAAYALNTVEVMQSPASIWFCTVLPQAAVGWMLWYRLSSKQRLCMLPVLTLASLCLLVLLILGFTSGSEQIYQAMNLVQAWIIPAVILTLLAAAVISMRKGNLWLRRFFRYLLWSLPVVAAAWGYSALTGGQFHQTMLNAFSRVAAADHSFEALCLLFCKLVLIIFFLQAVMELINSLARQEMEIREMSMREQYAFANVEIMRQSQEETRKQRHEMQHHLNLLREMLAAKQDERAQEYVDSLLDQVASLPSGYYSSNMVVNTIAGYSLNLAKSEGIRVETSIKTGDKIPIKDEELCVLLTNLLENALEACRSMKPDQDRFISFALTSDEEHLIITCRNSFDGEIKMEPDGSIPTTKPDVHSHGYGIPAMKRIVDKNHGILEISAKDGIFTLDISF